MVVIFHDDERFLSEAVDSVRSQTFSDWELILADDGSSDGSTAIAHRYVAQDPTRTRYVVFLDSDDVWEPDKLAEKVAILDANPPVGLVVGASRYGWEWDQRATTHDRLRSVAAVPAGSGASRRTPRPS